MYRFYKISFLQYSWQMYHHSRNRWITRLGVYWGCPRGVSHNRFALDGLMYPDMSIAALPYNNLVWLTDPGAYWRLNTQASKIVKKGPTIIFRENPCDSDANKNKMWYEMVQG